MKPRPWIARPPRAGRGWLVLAADGREVCEIDGECEGDGAHEAEAIVRAVNAMRLLYQAVVLHRHIKSRRMSEDAFSEPGYRLARLAKVSRARVWRRATKLVLDPQAEVDAWRKWFAVAGAGWENVEDIEAELGRGESA